MRKLFTSLKAVVAAALVASMTLAASCSYDDSAINNRVDKVEKDLAALTERVAALEAKVGEHAEALAAFADGKVVVDVKVENGNTTVTLSDGTSFVIPAPVADTDTDTNTTVAPAKDADGVYYWAIYEGGEFVKFLEVENAKVPVYAEAGEGCDCVPAELKFSVDAETGNLLVSIDGGTTWVDSGISTETVSGACIFTDVVVNDDNTVTFVMVGGDEFTVAKAELIECEAARSSVYVIAGQTKNVAFTINDAVADINIMNQPFGWSANVVEASEVEGDNGGDAGVMPLAVGGTDYVLQINGPAQALVNAGFAAKEGVVSVHFNTAAGACKVLKVEVTLAEVTLAVDNSGNITIANSVATEQTNHLGEVFTDFADFWIGIMPKSLYDASGVDALRDDWAGWGEFNSSYATQRNTGLANVVDLLPYVEGEYEQEVINLTVEQLGQAFWPKFTPEIGGEYVIFISLDSESLDYYAIPVLDNAVLATYKKTYVEATLVEGSEKWNDATYKFNLAGYDNYVIGWMSAEEVEMYIGYGMGETFEEILPQYLGAYGVMSAGAILSGNYLDQDIKLSELQGMSLMDWAPSIYSETEYYMYVYPFNATTEMEFYTHTVVPENIVYCGTFATASLVAGDFAVAADYEVVTFEKKEIGVNVTLDGAYTVAYNWYDAPFLDSDEAVATIMADEYYTEYATVTVDEPTFNAEHYDYYGLANPIYLAMVVINEAGEYVYVEKAFEYVEPTLEQVAITSFEYVGRSYELDDNPETSGGDFVYDFTCADGTSYRMGLYWNYADAATGAINNGTYNYCYNALNAMYGGWDGFVIVSEAYYYDSTLTVTAETITWRIPGKVEYVYTIGAEGGDEPVEPEEPAIVELVSASAAPAASSFIGGTGYDVTFLDADGNAIVFQVQTKGNAYLREGSWNDQDYSWSEVGYINSVVWPGVSTPWPYEMIVEVVDGAYNINLAVMDWYAEGQPVYEAHYAGQIEGMTLPVEEEEVETELPNCENLTLYLSTAEGYTSIGMGGYGDIRLVDADGKNYINIEINDQPVVTCSYVHSGDPTGTSMASGTIYECNTYVSYSGPAPLTTETPKVNGGTMDVVVDGDNCTITINFTLQDGNTFTGTYTGVKPF